MPVERFPSWQAPAINRSGRSMRLAFGNGVTETRSFDLDYRMTVLPTPGQARIKNLTYGYDAAENVSNHRRWRDGGEQPEFRLRRAQSADCRSGRLRQF